MNCIPSGGPLYETVFVELKYPIKLLFASDILVLFIANRLKEFWFVVLNQQLKVIESVLNLAQKTGFN